MAKKLKDEKKNLQFCLKEIKLEKYTLDEGGEGFKAPREVQLMRTGTFDHPFFGTFEITEKVFKQMVFNFEQDVRRIRLAFDYGHASGDIAAGWFTGLRIQKDETLGESAELLAIVDWTPAGKKQIAEGEWKYTSAEFMENYIDDETKEEFGWTLFGAGLTNRPFIKGQDPIMELSEQQIKEKKGEIMNLEELQKHVTKLSNKIDSHEAEIKVLAEGNKSLTDANTKLEAANKILTDGKATAEKEAKEAGQKAKFDEMLKKGTVVEAQRDAYMTNDVAKFSELSQPVKLATQGSGANGNDKDIAFADAEDKMIKKIDELMKKDSDLTAREARHLAFSENKDLADAIQKGA